MLVLLNIIAPVFGLIAVGYAVGRLRLLSEATAQGVSEFAFVLAIPALLCRTIATAKFADLSPLGIWASYFGASAMVWIAATLLTRIWLARPAEDAPSIAMSAVFGNTVMLGLPLAIATFGPAGAAPAALILSIHAPILLTTGALHSAAVGRAAGLGDHRLLRSLSQDLVRNPIIVGILAGAAWRLTGWPLPTVVDRLLDLLASAGVPAALTALGLTLVSFEIKGQVPTLAVILVLKLVALPILAWLLAAEVFELGPLSAGVVTILAAMPSGANAYLFATHEGRAVNSASGAVALGTLLAAATAAVFLNAVGP